MESGNNKFAELPTEIICEILNFANDIETILKLSQTDKRMREIISNKITKLTSSKPKLVNIRMIKFITSIKHLDNIVVFVENIDDILILRSLQLSEKLTLMIDNNDQYLIPLIINEQLQRNHHWIKIGCPNNNLSGYRFFVWREDYLLTDMVYNITPSKVGYCVVDTIYKLRQVVNNVQVISPDDNLDSYLFGDMKIKQYPGDNYPSKIGPIMSPIIKNILTKSDLGLINPLSSPDDTNTPLKSTLHSLKSSITSINYWKIIAIYIIINFNFIQDQSIKILANHINSSIDIFVSSQNYISWDINEIESGDYSDEENSDNETNENNENIITDNENTEEKSIHDIEFILGSSCHIRLNNDESTYNYGVTIDELLNIEPIMTTEENYVGWRMKEFFLIERVFNTYMVALKYSKIIFNNNSQVEIKMPTYDYLKSSGFKDSFISIFMESLSKFILDAPQINC